MGDPPKKKRQHYVPQFVLRNFSGDGATVRAHVLESARTIDGAPIKGQCAESYFYGQQPDMENAFAESEAKVATFVRAVASGDLSAFTGEYRSAFALEELEDWRRLQAHPLYAVREFVFFQAHRTLASAQSFTNAADREAKWWLRRDPHLIMQQPEVLEHLDDVVISPSTPWPTFSMRADPSDADANAALR